MDDREWTTTTEKTPDGAVIIHHHPKSAKSDREQKIHDAYKILYEDWQRSVLIHHAEEEK